MAIVKAQLNSYQRRTVKDHQDLCKEVIKLLPTMETDRGVEGDDPILMPPVMVDDDKDGGAYGNKYFVSAQSVSQGSEKIGECSISYKVLDFSPAFCGGAEMMFGRRDRKRPFAPGDRCSFTKRPVGVPTLYSTIFREVPVAAPTFSEGLASVALAAHFTASADSYNRNFALCRDKWGGILWAIMYAVPVVSRLRFRQAVVAESTLVSCVEHAPRDRRVHAITGTNYNGSDSAGIFVASSTEDSRYTNVAQNVCSEEYVRVYGQLWTGGK